MAITDILGFTGNAGPKGTLGDAAVTGDARRFIGAGEVKQQALGAANENLAGQRDYNLALAEYEAWKRRHDAGQAKTDKIIAGQAQNPNRVTVRR